MNISAPFVYRPVATSLIMAALLLVGLLAYRELPVAALPTIETPIIQVTTSLPGGSPDVVASSITTPLESHLSHIPGLVSISSVSSFRLSTITLQFSLSRKMDSVAQDVQSALSARPSSVPQSSVPADIQQSEPCRHADPDARGDVADDAPRQSQ